ncbi:MULTISPECIES: AEC family transporter [unclassified Luteococcus]|uniref:AEC family transporter n=1 Tax=unclassified Luteococcus TaxID=2639923 RepID=UPI00313E7975
MTGVLGGFFTIWSVVGVGWLLAHLRILDTSSQLVLTKLSFFAGSPALMLTMMASADLKRIFAQNLLVSVLATVATGLLCLGLLRWVLREPDGRRPGVGHTVIATFCASYVNAGNMGLPIAAYVLHDVTWIAPLLLVQVAVLQPLGLAFLDIDAARDGGQRSSWRRNAMMPLRNPMTLGVLTGLALNLTGANIPNFLDVPLTMLGGLAVPTMLIAFGVSLRLGPLPGKGPLWHETLVLSGLKLFVQPLLALVLARLFGLDRVTTMAVLVLAGLPTAQNIFSHAVRYQRQVVLARDVVFITSIASIGTIMTMALVLG